MTSGGRGGIFNIKGNSEKSKVIPKRIRTLDLHVLVIKCSGQIDRSHKYLKAVCYSIDINYIVN